MDNIQDILQEDKKDLHKWALNYYSSKPSILSEGYIDQIESLYHQSKMKPDDKLLFAYLDLCNKTKPTQYGFKRLIDVGEQLESSLSKNKYFEALILGLIANSYIQLNKFEEAKKAYRASLKIFRDLHRKQRIIFKPQLANALNNIAYLYSDLKRYDESEKAYQEALKIRRELADRNPEAFRPDLAKTLNNIAIQYSNLKRYDESEKAYQEALKIRRELADRNPEAFRPDLANTRNNIAGLFRNLKRYDESEKAYQEALKIRRELADRNPEAFRPDLAETLSNIASTSGLI
jgi:tetratricopeptide (TPR) repeat protein